MTRITALLSILLAVLAGSALAAKDSKKSAATTTASTDQSMQTRDWSKIDTDRDGYVAPDEMEKFLQSVWSQHGKSTATQEKGDKSN